MKTIILTPDKNCKVKSKSIFKSSDAFHKSDTIVCYIDHNGNSYTRKDFLELSGMNPSLAEFLFDTVVTKAPAEVIKLWQDKGELPL